MNANRPPSPIFDYNAANPRRKQDPVSPAHALIQKAMFPRHYQLLMFLHRNPGATKQGICELMKWPLWKVHHKFTKMSRCGLVTRRNVGSKLCPSRFRYYLTQEGSLIAQMVIKIEEVLVSAERLMDWEE